MKKRSRILIVLVLVGLITFALLWVSNHHSRLPVSTTQPIRFGIIAFQDTLLPILGTDKYKKYYSDLGLKVDFDILGWQEVLEALSGGQIDVAIYNDSGVIAVHHQNPEIIYYYGVNTFDNGFALLIRPDGKLKSLAEIEATTPDHATAVRLTAAQLKGKTVVTTGSTDMEQGVAAAARKGGLRFSKDSDTDVKIIDLPPDEGLAAFLAGSGDAYIGGIPQRTRATKEGMIEMLTGVDLGPAPINGLVTTRKFATDHPQELLKLLNAWFKIVNYVNANEDDAAKIIVAELNQRSAANFTVDDFKRFWQNYERYPLSHVEAERDIISPSGRDYWKNRWDDDNAYYYNTIHSIPKPVAPEEAFFMETVQAEYVRSYGSQ